MKQKIDTKTAASMLTDGQSQFGAIQKVHGILELNSDGSIATANTRFLELVGYTLKEVQGKQHRGFMEPAYAEGDKYKDLWTCISRGECHAGESLWLNKQGKEVWLHSFYHLIHDENGNVIRIVMLSQDITSIKLQRLISESEHKVLLDIINITSIVSYADLKGQITDINEKFVEVSKYSRKELIGSPHNITRHPDMPKATFKQVWNTIGHGRIFRGVIKNRAKDGTPYYVDAVIAPIMGNRGKPIKYVGVRYDITTQEEERQNMKGILDAFDTSYAYVEFTPEGNVLKANKNFLQVFGYQDEEVSGKHHRMFVENDYAGTAEYNQFWEGLKNGENRVGVVKRITKSGKVVWLQAVYAPVKDEMGRVVKVVKISADITKQTNDNIEYQKQVKVYSQFIELVAGGDLRSRVDPGTDNELSTVGNNLNLMVEGLANITTNIDKAGNTLLKSVEQIQATISTQAAGAAQQASAVSEITATLEELRVTSAQNLAKAKQLGDIAQRVQQESEFGRQLLQQTVSGMAVIRERVQNIAQNILMLSEQTQQIGEITDVVSNIAQQSKMLALNASIEAAKAGEAGKGFAVVAAEVKELAVQSQQSTAQVQKILTDIRRATDRTVMATEEGNKRVDDGVILVEQSGEMMKKLGNIIEEASLGSRQIVAAVQQEVTGIDQVTSSMNEINKVTSQFVVSSEQTKLIAADANKVANTLKVFVDNYKI